MIFDIATFKIKVRSQKSALFNFPESFYKDFNDYRYGKRCRGDFIITVVPYNFFRESPKKLVRRQSHLYHERKGICIIKSRRAIACVNAHKNKILLGFKGKGNEKKNNMVLMAFVRLAASLCAIQKGGLPFHCSAITFGKSGIAFSGPSGAGKSTIAKLLTSTESTAKSALSPRAILLLNDDFNIILPGRENSYRIYSTPFTQTETMKMCVKRGADLRAIFFIEKYAKNTTETLAFKNRYILMLGQTFIFPLSDFFGRKILDNAEKICTYVECRRLRFKNDGSLRTFMEHYAKGLV
jgi:hypothetical protein